MNIESKTSNLGKSIKLGLLGVILGITTINAQENAKGRAMVTIEPFVFPSYARVELQNTKDTTKTYVFEADHMGIINYELPLDSLQMKTNGKTTYTGIIKPSENKEADTFKPFYTTLSLNGKENLTTIEPIKRYAIKND